MCSLSLSISFSDCISTLSRHFSLVRESWCFFYALQRISKYQMKNQDIGNWRWATADYIWSNLLSSHRSLLVSSCDVLFANSGFTTVDIALRAACDFITIADVFLMRCRAASSFFAQSFASHADYRNMYRKSQILSSPDKCVDAFFFLLLASISCSAMKRHCEDIENPFFSLFFPFAHAKHESFSNKEAIYRILSGRKCTQIHSLRVCLRYCALKCSSVPNATNGNRKKIKIQWEVWMGSVGEKMPWRSSYHSASFDGLLIRASL